MQMIYTCRLMALPFFGKFQNKSAVTPSIFSCKWNALWWIAAWGWAVAVVMVRLRDSRSSYPLKACQHRLLMNGRSHGNVTDGVHGWIRGWILNSRDHCVPAHFLLLCLLLQASLCFCRSPSSCCWLQRSCRPRPTLSLSSVGHTSILDLIQVPSFFQLMPLNSEHTFHLQLPFGFFLWNKYRLISDWILRWYNVRDG